MEGLETIATKYVTVKVYHVIKLRGSVRMENVRLVILEYHVHQVSLKHIPWFESHKFNKRAKMALVSSAECCTLS